MSTKFSTISAKRLQTLLLGWFDHHGRKNLPWQINKTPYKVWVSEIMLQQTQVNTVQGYFARFIQAFPTVYTLASAQEDEVLHLWSGLGYYSRAHNLHKTSQVVVREYGGEFPNEVNELVKLFGIGLSTAGAIVSLAFNKPAAILDGNVKRVLVRLLGIVDPINRKETQEYLWQMARKYVPAYRNADYTQALMDIGATICTRRKPKCELCPFYSHCIAHKKNCAEQLPIKDLKPQLPIQQKTFVVLRLKDKILLKKRSNFGIWRGLWSFPEFIGLPMKESLHEFCSQELACNIGEVDHLTSFRHTFSHFHLDIHPVLVKKSKFKYKLMEGEAQIWYNLNAPQALGIPKPVHKILEMLE